MGRLREAESKEELLAIKEMIEEGARERSRELRNVGRVKWSGVVEWGGLGEGRRECECDIIPLHRILGEDADLEIDEQYREPW
jgi:hypothetical protein